MRICILNESKQSLGGGWTFIRNFKKGMRELNTVALESADPEITSSSDLIFIPSPSMVQRDTVKLLKELGKKIVLRLDNIPRNSRNRGAGTSRLYDIAQMADKIVYQSEWARQYLYPFIKKDGDVVYNGVDTNIFKDTGPKKDFLNGQDKKVYLYSRYSRDETKMWEVAWYKFQMIHRREPAKLIILGRYSEEIRAYNFDFYMGEDYQYLGVIEDQEELAQIYRGCNVLLAPYFNDAYSNTIQEAMACGLFLDVDESGGTKEMISNGVISLKQMAGNYLDVFEGVLK